MSARIGSTAAPFAALGGTSVAEPPLLVAVLAASRCSAASQGWQPVSQSSHRAPPTRPPRAPVKCEGDSTVPLRSRFIAALSVSHGDRRMRGRTQLNTAPDAEGQQPLQSRNRLPRKLGQVFGDAEGERVTNRCGIEQDPAVQQFLRTVAVRFRRWVVPWSGVPP